MTLTSTPIAQAEVPIALEFTDLPKDYSLARYLSGLDQLKSGYPSKPTLFDGGEFIDPVLLFALALTEACRDRRRGSFYHLPLRQNKTLGHPCDLVFIDCEWNEACVQVWNEMDWMDRLTICATKNGLFEMQDFQKVIPICARIFDSRYNVNAILEAFTIMSTSQELVDASATDADNDSFQFALHIGNREAFPTSTLFSPDNSRRNVSNDPAIRLGRRDYSRPIEDISTMLIQYDYVGAIPFVCRTGAADHDSVCQRLPTEGDTSVTFVRKYDLLSTRSWSHIEFESDRQRRLIMRAVQSVACSHGPDISHVLDIFYSA